MNQGFDYNTMGKQYTNNLIEDYEREVIEIDDMSEEEWLDYIVEDRELYKDRLKRDNKRRMDMGKRLNMSEDTMKVLSREGYDRIRVSDQQLIEPNSEQRNSEQRRYRLTLLHGDVVEVQEEELDKYDLRLMEECY
jgi:hypothetical protein